MASVSEINRCHVKSHDMTILINFRVVWEKPTNDFANIDTDSIYWLVTDIYIDMSPDSDAEYLPVCGPFCTLKNYLSSSTREFESLWDGSL